MVEVLPWQHSPDAHATLLRVVQALNDGELVIFPTDTTYVLAARPSLPAAVENLPRHSRPTPEPPLTLAVVGPVHALELLPDMSVIGRRLARRCWPGPVTL